MNRFNRNLTQLALAIAAITSAPLASALNFDPVTGDLVDSVGNIIITDFNNTSAPGTPINTAGGSLTAGDVFASNSVSTSDVFAGNSVNTADVFAFNSVNANNSVNAGSDVNAANSVNANNSVNALGGSVNAGFDVFAGNNVTALNGVTAGFDVNAGNNVFATNNVIANNSVIATDVFATNSVNAADVFAANSVNAGSSVFAGFDVIAGNDVIAVGNVSATDVNAAGSVNLTNGSLQNDGTGVQLAGTGNSYIKVDANEVTLHGGTNSGNLTVNDSGLTLVNTAVGGAITGTTTIDTTGNLTTSGSVSATDVNAKGTVTAPTVAATTGNITTVNATNVNTTNVAATGTVTAATVAATTGNITTVNATNVNVTGTLTANNLQVNFNNASTTGGVPVLTRNQAVSPVFNGADSQGRPTTIVQTYDKTTTTTTTASSRKYDNTELSFGESKDTTQVDASAKYSAPVSYDANGIALYGANTPTGVDVPKSDTSKVVKQDISVGKGVDGFYAFSVSSSDTTTNNLTGVPTGATNSTDITSKLIKTTGDLVVGGNTTLGATTATSLSVGGKDITAEITRIDDAAATEKKARTDADVALNTRVDDEVKTRTDADVALNTRVDGEVKARTDADVALNTRVDDEVKTRTDADVALNTRVDTEVADRTAVDTAIVAAAAAETVRVNGAMAAETTARTNADTVIRTDFTAADTAIRNSAAAETVRVNSEVNRLDGRVTSLASTVDNNFRYLDGRVNQVERTANRGVAISLAAQQSVPNLSAGRTAVYGGVGYYEGESALAFGVATMLKDNRTAFSLAIGASGSNEIGGRAGVSFIFGE